MRAALEIWLLVLSAGIGSPEIIASLSVLLECARASCFLWGPFPPRDTSECKEWIRPVGCFKVRVEGRSASGLYLVYPAPSSKATLFKPEFGEHLQSSHMHQSLNTLWSDDFPQGLPQLPQCLGSPSLCCWGWWPWDLVWALKTALL